MSPAEVMLYIRIARWLFELLEKKHPGDKDKQDKDLEEILNKIF